MKHNIDAKILIIGDYPPNVLLLKKILNGSDYYNILCISDTRDVMNKLPEYNPDLILFDLDMLYTDGFEVWENLKLAEKQKGFPLPVIVITSRDDKEERFRALSLGAVDFIGKPYDQTELMLRIRNTLSMHAKSGEMHVQNKQLKKEMRGHTENLLKISSELIQHLTAIAKYNENGPHITRMGRYSVELGKAAGLDETECELLFYASILHDIGKITIPKQILQKPGKLTAEEWEQLKTHTLIGAEFLSGSSTKLLQMAEVVALTHHEKWDGTGYPNGLQGEAIPLVGRITALCDVFDVLTSETAYKEAWSIEEAVKEIDKESGTHFDPTLVAHFHHILPSIIEIRQQY